MENYSAHSVGVTTDETKRSLYFYTAVLLAIEFADELVSSAHQAAWPLIRTELHLSYTQIGMLLSIPHFISNLIEPLLCIFGDTGYRRKLVLGGGIIFTIAQLLIALSGNFYMLLAAMILIYPAGGAFVGLAQATLMDLAPERHTQNMARWTLAGSVAMVMGSLLLSATLAFGLGWRTLFSAFTIVLALLVVAAWRLPFTVAAATAGQSALADLKEGLRGAWRALRSRAVVRWLTLLAFSNLMLDVLGGFLTLYFVDVVKKTPIEAVFAVIVWIGVGLTGDLLLIPLLERVDGLRYLRANAAVVLCLFPLFLLLPTMAGKLLVLALLGILNAGWYSILKAQLYSTMPGRSGIVLAVYNIFGVVEGLIPLALGLIAERYGLSFTMWLLLIAPLALLVGIPRKGD